MNPAIKIQDIFTSLEKLGNQFLSIFLSKSFGEQETTIK